VALAWLQIPSAGRVTPVAQATLSAPAGPAANPADELARLEAKAARLTRQYRGQLVTLNDAETAAEQTTASVLRLRDQIGYAHQQVARIAAASFMGVAQHPTLVILGGGNAQQMLQKAATLEYLSHQRSAREQALLRLMAAEQRAERAAQAKIAQLSRVLTKLTSQRQNVAALMARFKPESPVTGDSITARMLQVKNEVDRRFGPFISIGCFRPGERW
jgi:septal ring factor EnvC (AmiA/AmiB activator)